MKKLFLVLLIGLFIMPFMSHAQETDRQTPDEICASALPAPEPPTRQFTQPEQVLVAGVDYSAIFCTENGAVYVDLFETLAPKTVNSFVFLAQSGYYNNTTFHRIIADFMAQGGDHTGTGSGSPGYTVVDEYVSYMTFDRVGLLATANSNNPDADRFNTNGSQFFITTELTGWLNYNHSIFGEVLVGQDIVENLPLRDPGTATTPGPALNTVVIITDRSSVISGYEPPAPATFADFEAVLPTIEVLPWATQDDAATGVFDTVTTIAQLPEAIQADTTTFFATYEHQFTASIRHTNTTCDLTSVPIASLSETVFVFSSRENAVNAQNDAQFTALVTQGNADITETVSEYYGLPIFTWTTTACDAPVVRARMVRQLGRMIVVTEMVYAQDSDVQAEVWLDDLSANYYDASLASVFRPEANQ
jgi:cyclophilin family peptidyl-prolyl cis-trans isomerase